MNKHKNSSSGNTSSTSTSSNNNNHSSNNRNRPGKQIATEPEITKLDYAVANYLRKTLPDKEAMFVGIKRVNYFIGSKAVDALMESKWAKADPASDQRLFKNRDDAAIFMNDLLLKRLFHRARKIVKMDGAKKKFKLDMHDQQFFEDTNQPYVWLYEPTSLQAWLLCFGVIFGVIAICLFPLWPPIIRTWVYYICIAGLVFLSSILTLALVRHVIFFALWVITFGKLHFWILPNLTEDVGFFESFWPLYAIGESTGLLETEGTNGPGGSGAGGEGGGDASHSHQD